jgi:hypothetical protein
MTEFITTRWERLMNWTPTDKEIARIAELALACGRLVENTLKAAVIAMAIYLIFEIGAAFLPGGPAARLLGGQ